MPEKPAAPAEGNPVVSVPVEHVKEGGVKPAPRPDDVAVEAPLELRFGGKAATLLMRTPGDDEELVLGFLLSEGLIAGPDDVVRMRRPSEVAPGEEGNVLDVELFPSVDRKDLDRPLYSSSSCGTCGKRSIASLEIPAAPIPPGFRVPRALLSSLPTRMRSSQSTFEKTGGVHASALFDRDGNLVVLREDVGRHNAVDKVVGWALAARRIPLADHVLQVSGRISYELAQKAIVAGIPVLAAVGAPSSLAIEIANRYGLTLVGFVRPGSLNVYTHPERVA